MLKLIEEKFADITAIIVAVIIAIVLMYSVNRMTSDNPWGWIKVNDETCLDLRYSYSIPFTSRKIYCPVNQLYQDSEGNLRRNLE